MMICRLLDYLALLYLAVTPPCAAERLPPPRNMSYAWLDPFHVNLSWLADPRPPGCSRLTYRLKGKDREENISILSRQVQVVNLSSDARFTLRTICQRYDDSEEVSVVIPRQVQLVSDFQFFLYPACERSDVKLPFCGMQATWTPLNGTSRLQMFYRSCSALSADLSACQVFDIGGRGQGCHLVGLPIYDVCIIFQGAYGDRAQLNQTFAENPNKRIKTPRPDVDVAEQGHYLQVTWQHATVCDQTFWRYRVNYSECGRDAEEKMSDYGATSLLVPFDKECRYELQVQPLLKEACGKALADISNLFIYNDGASRDQSVAVLLVAVPAILSVVVLMLCCYVRRKRKAIIKNILVPPSALKEMMSSFHQRQLVIPMPEKVNVCVVSPPEVEEEEVEEVDLLMLEVT